ncbi:hypothetical protein N7512_000852 [Penicillium capsulatum]|nr:hypothetical protein N7512_000852 [Penicillium capsulatum]
MYLQERWSDMKIECGDCVFPAHQCIVYPRSDYLAAAANGQFNDPPGVARITKGDPFLVEKVLEYIYKGSYTSMGSPLAEECRKPSRERDEEDPESPSKKRRLDESPASRFQQNPGYFHARMYAEGDFLMIPELKETAKKGFEDAIKIYFAPENFAAIVEEVYSDRTDYKEFQKLVVSAAIKNLASLRTAQPTILTRGLLASVPEFAEDLCMAFIKKHDPRGLNVTEDDE